MKTLELKKLIPHVSAVVLFVLISLIYLSPVLEGKKIDQQDIRQFTGMSKEIVDHRVEYDEEPLWTNSMFSGMPAYQISVRYKKNLISYCSQLFKLYLPGPAGTVFLYLLGFYFLLVSLGIDYRLAIIGAIAYAFSSYFFIIIEAGHNTKAHAIGYVAPILASFLMVFRGKKVLLGSALTALFTSLILNANHLQITYYLVMLLFIIGIVKFIEAYKEKALPLFFKYVGILLLAGTIGSLTSLSRIATTMEYGQESIRGKSELTDNQSNKTSGLDKDYATAWSYGKAESFTLLIPNFHGGASGGALTTDSETYRLFKNSQQASQAKNHKTVTIVLGSQPFTSGPVYAGAIVCFLFVMGLFLIKGYLRWWILTTFLLMLALSWGKNLMPLTDFFLEYIPGYNKFRTVSTTLVIVELLIPFLAILALNKIIKEGKTNEIMNSFKYALGIVGGLCLIFALMPNTLF